MGKQPDFAVDGAPVALECRVRAVLFAPEHLPKQAIEHQHRIVGEGNDGFEDGRHQCGATPRRLQRPNMLRGQPHAFLAQASEALGMDAYGDIRIDPDGPKQCQSLDDGGECLSAGLAG